MKSHCRNPGRRSAQRGAATLVVVMLLFFVMALVAAYTNRNLIFEQRTSANQYRATQALEAAEAGIEWALAMLSHQRIDAACQNSASLADSNFRDRYLLPPDPNNGRLARRENGAGGALALPGCVWNGAQWTCSCPSNGNPVLTPPSGSGVFPAFRVRFETIVDASLPKPPGTIRISVVGCTRLGDDCLDFSGSGQPNEGRAVVRIYAALTGNIAAPPVAALVAREGVALPMNFVVANTDPAGSGITVQAGGAVNAATQPSGIAGTPGLQSIVADDSALSTLSDLDTYPKENRMFAAFFNVAPRTFEQQPAMVRLPACAGGACTAADVLTAVSLNPGRPIWVPGNLDFATAVDIGTAAEPVLLVVEGNLTFSAGGPSTIYGLVYLRTPTWTTSGSGGTVQGAVIAEGAIASGAGTGTQTVVHDAGVLSRLRWQTGSFVRVPGSWKDYQ